MKKVFYLLIIMYSANFSFGQIGVQAGLNMATLAYDLGGSSIESNRKYGLHVGLTYDFSVSNKVLARPGIFYSMKGAKGADDFSISLNYIDLPLMFVYQFNPGKGFLLEFGPNIGLLLSANAGDMDVKDSYKSSDIGLNLGVGYDFGNFILGIRGGVGLTAISEIDLLIETDIKNRMGQLYAIYKIGGTSDVN